MTRWYYTPDNKQRFGPVTAEQLRQLAVSGTVHPGCMVMPEAGGKWVPAAKVKGLFSENAVAPLPFTVPRQPGGLRMKGLWPFAAAVLAVGSLVGAGLMFGERAQKTDVPDGPSLARDDDSRKSGDAPEKPADKQGEGPGQTPANPVRPSAKKHGDDSAISVRADELFAAYGSDVVAADKRYTARTLELTNVSGKVQKDREGRYYLVAVEYGRLVKRPDQGARIMSIAEYQRHLQEAALNAKYIPGIVLYVDAKAAEPFSGLGEKMVTIRGKCKGTTEDQSTQPGYFVTLESVQLVRASSPEVVVRRPEKPVAKPPVEPPPGEKVLDLIEVVRLEDKWRQAREEFVERDGSNMVASNELQKAQDNERTPLVGRVVEGVVIIPWVGGRQKGNSDTVCINVNFGRVEVSLPTEVWQGGRMVKVRGTITRSTSGIYLENCTFSVPAKEDRAVPRSLKPPLPIADVIRQELQRKTEESVALLTAAQ